MKWTSTISRDSAPVGSTNLAERVLSALLRRPKRDTFSQSKEASAVNLGEFQTLVLISVNILGEEAYGMKIRDQVQTIANRPVHMPQVYAALSRLEMIGALASEANHGKSAGHRGRTRRYYKLKARGLQLLSDVVRLSHGARPKEPNSNEERKKAATA